MEEKSMTCGGRQKERQGRSEWGVVAIRKCLIPIIRSRLVWSTFSFIFRWNRSGITWN
jgi:hypothetical protein